MPGPPEHDSLAGPHGVDIAAERVDLAVVAEHALGVGPLPAGEGVGAEARVHHRYLGPQLTLPQVAVVVEQLERREQTLNTTLHNTSLHYTTVAD